VAYFVNIPDDLNLGNNEYTSASGDNRNTGKNAGAPKPNPVNILRIYEITAGDTLYIDTGVYPLIETVLLSGQAGVGDDEGLTMTGPTGADVAEFVTAIPGRPDQDLIELHDADLVKMHYLTLTGGRHGVYVHTDSLSLTATNIITADNNASGVYMIGGSDVATLDGLTTYGHPTAGRYGLYINGGAGGIIQNVTAYGNDSGVYLYDVSAVTLNTIETHDNTDYGLYARSAQIDGSGVTAYNNATGIYLYDSNNAAYSLLANPVSYSNATGIILERYVNIAGGASHNNTGYGISTDWNYFQTIDGTDAYENGSHGVYLKQGEIKNARIYGNVGDGVFADYNTAHVRGSVIYGNDYGVRFTTNYGGIAVTNNLIYDNDNGGVLFDSALSSSGTAEVVNNTIYQAAGDALHLTNTSKNVHLRNNILGFAGYEYGSGITGIANDMKSEGYTLIDSTDSSLWYSSTFVGIDCELGYIFSSNRLVGGSFILKSAT
ncbi:hypothetical protein LCGC14_2527620, partial [marine sediment metagenome]